MAEPESRKTGSKVLPRRSFEVKNMRRALIIGTALILAGLSPGVPAMNESPSQAGSDQRTSRQSAPPAITPLVRTVDLDVGEAQKIELTDGKGKCEEDS
jgi:hypothetical protein